VNVWAAPERPPGPSAELGLTAKIRHRLVASRRPASPEAVGSALREVQPWLGAVDRLEVAKSVHADLAGLGPLQRILSDPRVSDICVNASREVWIDRGDGMEPAGVAFEDEHQVRSLAVRLAQAAGRRLDDSSPFVDAALPEGIRLHAVLPPVADGGTCISLRIPRSRGFSMAELVDAGTVSPAGAELLQRVVRRRLSFLVSGGAGSGKTTLLGALLSLAAPGERLVLVEDTAELIVRAGHLVRLQGRPANAEGSGAIAQSTLVRQALRMRPDRLVVGECRGVDVLDLLSALNTGHDGGCGTVHANRACEVPARLEALAAPAGLARNALHSLLAAAVDAVIHLDRRPDGVRRVAELALCRRLADGRVEVVGAYRRLDAGEPVPGPAAADLDARLAGTP